MSDLQNARKPVGEAGEAILDRMNRSHAQLSEWGLGHMDIPAGDAVVDIGCGGGANVERLLKKVGESGKVWGVDYSDVSVAKSTELNRDAIAAGRCQIVRADVRHMPFADETFDRATAFETIYFWPDMDEALNEVWRVLRMGGQLLVCNESSGLQERDEALVDEIDGMRMYSRDELVEELEAAGFRCGEVEQTPEGWLCAVATKVHI